MTDRDQYTIKVQGKLIEVTPDVYYAYFQMRRQERGQEEKKQRNDVVSEWHKYRRNCSRDEN